MSPPPFLLGATLLFWGWQTDFLLPACIMAVLLEGARWLKVRWELSNEDFTRIWVFCTLLFMGAAVYAFTSNDGPADFRGLLQNPNFVTQRNAGTASARTAAALLRWLPMLFFFFIAAQAFSSRKGIPLETISLILRVRWRRARKLGLPVPPSRSLDIGYPYFGICLLAASAHTREDNLFYYGLCALLAWALWAQRSRRFRFPAWASALAVAVVLGFVGYRSLGQLQRYLEGLNAGWLAGFGRHGFDAAHTRTSLGDVGRVKTSGRIVIRLQPKRGSPPEHLREATYRKYQSQTWYLGSARNDYETISDPRNKGSFVLEPDQTNTSCINIACYLRRPKGTIPLAEGSGTLENSSTYLLYKLKTGTVLAEGPGLVMYDDCFLPGRILDSAPERDEDEFVPPKEQAALSNVIDELQLPPNADPTQILKAVSRFFESKFTYSTWQGPLRGGSTNETPLARFLLNTRSGHCEYFATATVLLLRKLHVPARYAVGYAVHEVSGKQFVVRQRDAHAWCLVWNDKRQLWQDFDTTPGTWLAVEAQHASHFQFLSDAWSRFVFEFSKVRWGQSRLRQYFLWSLVPILGLLLFQIIFRSRRQRRSQGRTQDAGQPWPGLDSEFYQLEARLRARGLNRPPGQTLWQWLNGLQNEPALIDVRQPLEELVRLHYRYRFDPQGLLPTERDALRRNAHTCLARFRSRRRIG